jgi:hypothetical protein
MTEDLARPKLLLDASDSGIRTGVMIHYAPMVAELELEKFTRRAQIQPSAKSDGSKALASPALLLSPGAAPWVLRLTVKACDVARARISKPHIDDHGLQGEGNVGEARAAARRIPEGT